MTKSQPTSSTTKPSNSRGNTPKSGQAKTVKSGSTPVGGSGQVQMKADKGQRQGAGQEVSPAGVGDRLDSMTKDNER